MFRVAIFGLSTHFYLFSCPVCKLAKNCRVTASKIWWHRSLLGSTFHCYTVTVSMYESGSQCVSKLNVAALNIYCEMVSVLEGFVVENSLVMWWAFLKFKYLEIHNHWEQEPCSCDILWLQMASWIIFCNIALKSWNILYMGFECFEGGEVTGKSRESSEARMEGDVLWCVLWHARPTCVSIINTCNGEHKNTH